MRDNKKVIPPSQRKTSFVITYAMGGIGLFEVTILLITLIVSILFFVLVDIVISLFVSMILFMISFYLIYTDKKSNLKGWEKIIRISSFYQSKKKFNSTEISTDLFPYKFDDGNQEIKLKKNYISFIKVSGKDISKMSDFEREEFILEYSRIISHVSIPITFFKNSSEPDKYDQIDYFNKQIIEQLNKNDIDLKTKQMIATQLQSYAIDEILKKISNKTTYIFAFVGSWEELEEEKRDFISSLREIGISSEEFNYEKSKQIILNFYNPFFNFKEEYDIENILKNISFNKNHIKFGDYGYGRILTFGKTPSFVPDGWFSGLTFDQNVIPSFKVLPLNQEEAIKNIDIAIQRNDLRSSNLSSKSSSKAKGELELINDIYKQIIEDINNDSEQIKDFVPIFMIIGKTISEIKKTQKALSKTLKKDGFQLKELPYIQFNAFETFLPKLTSTIKNEIAIELPTLTIGSSFPMIIDDFIDDKGIFISYTSTGGEIYWNNELRDDYRFNSNSIILGSSGSGKSVLTYKLVTNDFLKGNKVFIIDPEQEYIKLSRMLGGRTIDLGGDGINKINPFQINRSYEDSDSKSHISKHVSFLSSFFEMTNSRLDQEVSILLQKELISFYQELRITNEKINRDYASIQWPIFQDFLTFVELKSKRANGKMLDIYELTLLIISQYTEGGTYSDLWNGKQNINFNEQMIVFDTSSLINDKYKIAGQMLFITKIIWSLIQENRKINESKKQNNYSSIYIDEAHLLMNKNNLFALEWIQMVTKRIRKYNGKLFLITQNVKDFLGDKEISHYTEGILNNISYSFIGKMQPKDLESLDTMYSSMGGLSIAEKSWIANSGRGKFLLKIGDRLKYYINKVNINPNEARLFAPQILDSIESDFIKNYDALFFQIYKEYKGIHNFEELNTEELKNLLVENNINFDEDNSKEKLQQIVEEKLINNQAIVNETDNSENNSLNKKNNSFNIFKKINKK